MRVKVFSGLQQQGAGTASGVVNLDCIIPDVADDAVVTAFDVNGEVFTDKTVKQRAGYVLPEIPAAHQATNLVGDLPDLALQGGTLLNVGYCVIPAWFGRRHTVSYIARNPLVNFSASRLRLW